MRIAILTPSRARPGRLDSFIQSVYSTASDPSRVYCYNYIDSDDPRVSAYNDYSKKQHQNSTNIVSDPQSVSKSWNVLAEAAMIFKAEPVDVLIMGNDDMVYRTQEWDTLLRKEIEKYPDQIYCMWFEDLINGQNHCAFPIVSRKWYETLGYFTPGIFNFLYNDTWIYDLGQRVGRIHFIPNVVNEHLHFTTGKSTADETTIRNRTPERFDARIVDKKIFDETSHLREKDAEKLRAVMSR